MPAVGPGDVTVRRDDARLEVDGVDIAVTVYDGGREPRALVWCLPGGGVDRRYWDVPVEGAPDGEFSFPHRAAAAGYLVVAADHLGTGESTRVHHADADRVVDAMSAALALARAQLGAVEVPSVGVGHSMGSGLMLHQQDRHQDHAALVVTGWSNIALTLPFADGEMYPLGTPGKPDMRRHNHGEGVPPSVRAANRRIRTVLPQPALDWVTRAGRLAPAARRIDVPVLLAHGREDVTPDPDADAALYERAPSVQTVVLPRSHHWHSGSPDRHVLWDAMIGWLGQVLPPRP